MRSRYGTLLALVSVACGTSEITGQDPNPNMNPSAADAGAERNPTGDASTAAPSDGAAGAESAPDAQNDGPPAADGGTPDGSLPAASVLGVSRTHACVVKKGKVKCWGTNDVGELGNGSTTSSAAPVDVVGLAPDVASIAVGGGLSCALWANGDVRCWGVDADGVTTHTVPKPVTGLASGVRAVSAGSEYACAITAAGGVVCWGLNPNGQLGDGTTNNRARPVDVVGLSSGVVAIAAGDDHTCALTSAGAVKCWGERYLGNNSRDSSLVPVDVLGLSSGAVEITAGAGHSCARMTTGGVKCWGFNFYGQLGNNTGDDSLTIVDVVSLTSGTSNVSAGIWTSCAVGPLGVECWGSNFHGQLGDGSTTNSNIPVVTMGLPSNVRAVSVGDDQACAIDGSDRVYCWGKGNGRAAEVSGL